MAYQVSRSTVDKDWALSHFIDAIFSIEKCNIGLVFKGGTCLRKCYTQGYRFSEDRDFTTMVPDFILDQALLNETVAILGNRTRMPLHIEKMRELKHNNQRTGFAAVVKFWGADHAKDQAPPAPDRWMTQSRLK